jgi:hypothetical protein
MTGQLQTSALHMVACINLGRLLRALAQLPGSDEAGCTAAEAGAGRGTAHAAGKR